MQSTQVQQAKELVHGEEEQAQELRRSNAVSGAPLNCCQGDQQQNSIEMVSES
jgi:hypothetical protein